MEIATGLLFVSIFNQFLIGEEDFVLFFTFAPHQNLVGGSVFNFLNLIYYWTIASFLIIIFVYDLKHYLIPDRIIYPAIVIALIFNFLPHQIFGGGFNQFPTFKNLIFSAFGAAAFFLLIVLVSRGKWMGIGDIKLAFLMGLILGFPNILVALFLAFFLGAIIGLGLIFFGRKTFKSEIPFGPFLITGTFIGLFCGGQIINWYLKFFV